MMLEVGVGVAALQFAAPSWAAQTRAPMRMAYYDGAEPLSWLGEDSKMRGILVDTMEAVAHKHLRIQLTHEGFPWARAQLRVQRGESDAFCTIPTAERMTYSIASIEPMISLPFVMYAKVDGKRMEEIKRVTKIGDLQPFVHVSYIGSGWAKQHLSEMNLRSVPKVEDAVKMVAVGDADIFIDNQLTTRVAIKNMGLQSQIVELPQVLDHTQFHLCIRKESHFVKILPEFDRILKSLRRDGTLGAITAKYTNA
jgi:polar amino acid transport system substrate-binding protein